MILVGMLVLYIGFFLYEDEEGVLQNRITEFSKSLRAKSQGSDFPLVSAVAGFVNRALNRFLGNAMLSWRMLFCSVNLSFAGIFVLVGFICAIQHYLGGIALSGSIALVFVGVIFLTSKYPKPWVNALGCIPSAIFAYGWLRAFSIIGFCTLLVGLGSDILLVTAVRTSLRILLRESTALLFGIAISLQVAILAGMFYVPWILIDSRFLWRAMRSNHYGAYTILTQFMTGSFMLNISTGVMAGVFILILLFLLSHKIFWPTVARLLYPIARFKVMQNRKFLFSVAVTCFAMASPTFSEWLKKIPAWFK